MKKFLRVVEVYDGIPCSFNTVNLVSIDRIVRITQGVDNNDPSIKRYFSIYGADWSLSPVTILGGNGKPFSDILAVLNHIEE